MLLFLGIGFFELSVIFGVILLFFGADSSPKIARTLGRGFRQMKDATQDIQNEIKKSTNDITQEVKGIESDVKKTLDQE